MAVWLCPVRPSSWQTIKTSKVFGVPRQLKKRMAEVSQGDILVFHVVGPSGGIAAIAKVASDMFESHEDLWGIERYPIRVRIDPLFTRQARDLIPLSCLLGSRQHRGKSVIEPYLGNVWITKLTGHQYDVLKNVFASQAVRTRTGTHTSITTRRKKDSYRNTKPPSLSKHKQRRV
jgi:hypothetical protein